LSTERDQGLSKPAVEQSTGIPAKGAMDVGANEPIESSGLHHWRESTITQPGLDDRGNVFFAAIEMTRMPMILTDPNLPDNPIVFANKAFLDLTMYEEDEVLGRNCRFLQGAQTDRQQVDEMRQSVERRESVALEVLNYKRDGTPFWNAVFIGPVYDTSGTLLYFFASQLDVTRRRETEQSFRQAQKMESIGQLTAGLAHDFNNLLQVVNGNLEMLASRIDDPRSERYLHNARSAAERGAKLTSQLLAFARKTRLEPRPVDISECIHSFAEMIESSVGKQVEIHLSTRRGLPKAILDPEQFEMAILNIAINARDAMAEGGVITISTAKVSVAEDSAGRNLPAGDYLAVEVKDEGNGMSPDVLERAVEPFFTTKPTGKGTGLGLAMASGFVQQSRGRLEIESALGAGTRVRMLFPIAGSDLDADDTHQHRSLRANASLPEMRASHILVVEDSSEVMELALEILTEAGYRVSTAPTGDAGLAAFKQALQDDPFDLVFTDLVMPGSINGIVLADQVSTLDPGVAVLMTTGYNEQLVVDGPLRSGRDVLGKPYRKTDLLDRIRQALNQRGQLDRTRRRPSDFGAAEA
jgi:PAS domain S-box-containing protein